jgi:hypothetical protein
MPQPGKAGERAAPIRRRRLQREGRISPSIQRLAAKGKIAGVNFVGDRGVAGAYILRRDAQTIGRDDPPRQQSPARRSGANGQTFGGSRR